MGIRNIAASETVYSRGLQDYKQNHIVNATWSNTKKQYRVTVKDNFEYQVVIQVFEDGSFEHKCNCSEHLKEQGACKHVVAALFFVLNYVERSMIEEPDNPAEKTVYNILGYFGNQMEFKQQGETYHLKLAISIPSIIRSDSGSALVSLRVGNNHYYKIQSVKKFLSDIYNKENIILGKEFKFIHGESKFDRQSQKVLDYILEIFEIQEAIDKLFYSKLFSKAQIVLTKNMLFRLLELLEESEISLELYGKTYEAVVYTTNNPKIKYDLSLIEDGIIMDYHGKYSVVPITEAGELLYYNGCIYKPSRRFLSNYLPFYNNLGIHKEPLVFKGVNKSKFLEVVLPRISETMELTVPKEIQDRFIVADLTPSVYLDKVKNNIQAELRFQYGEHEINAFENAPSDNFIIVRQPQKEDYYIDYMEKLGFQPKMHSFVMRNEEEIYEFLTHGIQELSKISELYYSEAFKKINIKSPGSFKAGLRVSNGMDLLEMDLNYEDVPKDELKDLFRSYRMKKKYYRLKNGNFVNLEDGTIQEVWDILNYLGVGGKDISGETISLSKNTALYLNKVFQEKSLEVEKNEGFSALVENILNPARTEYAPPGGIRAELRSYQVTGYKWLRTLASNNLGGILADDMGLGKTLQTIVYITSIKEVIENAKFLIVCPSSLIYNWQDEIENFAPMLTSVVVTGNPKERQDFIEDIEKTDILITSYPLIRRDINFYQKRCFHTVFIDEAQYIKNADSLNAKSVKLLEAEHKFALTGTPIENSLSELWSIFDFIMPDYLFSHTKFMNQYEKPILREEEGVLEDLNRRILPFILRRMKKDVLQELPDKVETKMLTDMSEEQKKIYMSYVENAKNEIDLEIKEKGLEKSKLKILAALTRLRQICCHPATFLENYEGGSGKLELLMEIITDAIANDHRILVFSQFTSMLGIIEKELQRQNIDNFYLEGSTKVKDRNDYVKRFNQGEGKVFLISLKAGGTGLNLVGADTVIHYDPWWNPAVEEQATDRAYRIGQVNSVHVIKLITKGTIEEKIYKLQVRKKNLSESVIQSQEVFINSLTKEELEDIFVL
jgi:SNF2 family DNA or RNA helicase